MLLDCEIEKDEFFIEQKPDVRCLVKNIGNSLLNDVEVCYEECETIDLGLAEERNITFFLGELEEGSQEAVITAKNKDISKTIRELCQEALTQRIYKQKELSLYTSYDHKQVLQK